MRRVSLREANQNFSNCVAEVERGERLVLLRRGKPVAEIIPYSTKRKPDLKREAARKKLMEMLEEGIDLGGKPLTREQIYAGR